VKANECTGRIDMPAKPSLLAYSTEALDRPIGSPTKRLFIGGERSVRRTLAVRSGIVVLLMVTVILAFWYDRDGLRDHHDGEISFSDVIYFSMVTITTVGYGDIVPISRGARVLDALLVTPIRLFIWFIFLGTAYQLVLQRLFEEIRMRMVRAKLNDHIVICGYGHSGSCAAAELVARGMDKKQILVIDYVQARVEAAAEFGYIGLLGDVTSEEVLRRAMLESARALFVCTERDDTNVLIVLTARHLSSRIRIISRAEEPENEKLLRQSGANAIVLPSRVGGILMADSLESSALLKYVMDLISAGGKIMLEEREAKPEDIGRIADDIPHVVRIMRGGQVVSASSADAQVRAGDKLITVRPAAPTDETSGPL
jgi:voltage-gated potassium channel